MLHRYTYHAGLTTSDHAREKGAAPNDETSYLASQKKWGPDPERNWPQILHRPERNELPAPDYPIGILRYNGKIVLDLDNRPILDYVDLPATLSTEFSGQHMETITRLDPRISHKDFRARMPKTRKGRRGQTLKPYSLSAIAMRMARFRRKHGLSSWIQHEGSKNQNKLPMSQLSQGNTEADSTQRVLSPSPVAQANANSEKKGERATRAGRQALSVKATQERDDKNTSKLSKLRAAESEANGQIRVEISTKRKRTNHASPDIDQVELVRKRYNLRRPSRPSTPPP